jgi:hypothetical protein
MASIAMPFSSVPRPSISSVRITMTETAFSSDVARRDVPVTRYSDKIVRFLVDGDDRKRVAQ